MMKRALLAKAGPGFAVLCLLAFAAQAQVPAAVPTAPPVDPGIAVPVPGEQDSSAPAYAYEIRGRRDPFRSLLLRTQDDKDRQRPPGVAGMLVEELELQGTIRTRQGWIGMMRGGDNRSYLLRKGTMVFDGEVMEIGPTEVVFRQNVNDPTSPKPFRDVVKALALQAKP